MSFESDVWTLAERVQNDETFALELYAALCNMRWSHASVEEPASLSWRGAGGTVADLRGMGEDYLAYYWSGNEGTVSDAVADALSSRGWTPLPWPEQGLEGA